MFHPKQPTNLTSLWTFVSFSLCSLSLLPFSAKVLNTASPVNLPLASHPRHPVSTVWIPEPALALVPSDHSDASPREHPTVLTLLLLHLHLTVSSACFSHPLDPQLSVDSTGFSAVFLATQLLFGCFSIFTTLAPTPTALSLYAFP